MTNEIDIKQVGTGTRLGTMLLDHLFMTIIAMMFSIPGMIASFTKAFNVSHEEASPGFMSGAFGYISLFGFALYFCKDSINGRSIAKRILKLQIVDNSTGQAASPLKCLVRNMFIIIWPVEAIVALVNPSRRLGDRVAGTKLVLFDQAIEQPKVDFVKIIIAIVISYALMFVLMLPIFSLESKIERQKINYVETSYNEQSSKETEKLYADSLGEYLSASVKVYDQIQDKPTKYISVIFQLKENYMEDDQSYEQLKSATIPLLLTKFPERTFVGRLKYVYQTNTSMQTRSTSLDWPDKK